MQTKGFLQALRPSFQIREDPEKFTRCDPPNRNVTACVAETYRNPADNKDKSIRSDPVLGE